MEAAKTVVTQKAYAGQWEAYQKDFSSMTISGKIDYYEELGVLANTFERARKKRWLMIYWSVIAFPLLLTALIEVSNSYDGPILNVIKLFVLGAIVYAVGWLLTRKAMVEKKFSGVGTLIFLAAYSLLALFQINSGYFYSGQMESLVGFLVIMGIILGISYVLLAGKGFIELRERALIEQTAVEENLRRQLYSGILTPISLRTKVSLNPMEEAYLEEPAMVIDMQNKEQYNQLYGQSFGNKARGYFDMVTGDKDFSTGLRKAWNSFLNEGSTSEKDKQRGRKRQARFEASQQALLGTVGSIIITSDKILYVADTTGFQIGFGDLVSYYAQEGEVNTLVLESKKGVRTLRTDAGPWIVLLLDRLRNRSY